MDNDYTPTTPISSYLFSCESLVHIQDFIYNSRSLIKTIFVSLGLEFSSVAWWAHQWVHQRLLVITFGSQIGKTADAFSPQEPHVASSKTMKVTQQGGHGELSPTLI